MGELSEIIMKNVDDIIQEKGEEYRIKITRGLCCGMYVSYCKMITQTGDIFERFGFRDDSYIDIFYE